MGTCYEFYIGLNDKNDINKSLDEKQVREEFLNYFSEYEINFSLSVIQGGYIHEDGSYVNERCIKITIIGNYENSLIEEFINGLKEFYHQESILLIKKPIQSEYRS